MNRRNPVKTADGLEWPLALFNALDERYIEEVPGLGLRVMYPGRPELFAYGPSSFTVAAGFSNMTRGLQQLLPCSTLGWIGLRHVGGGQLEVVRGPALHVPGMRWPIIFCSTPNAWSAGEALRAENQERMLAGKRIR